MQFIGSGELQWAEPECRMTIYWGSTHSFHLTVMQRSASWIGWLIFSAHQKIVLCYVSVSFQHSINEKLILPFSLLPLHGNFCNPIIFLHLKKNEQIKTILWHKGCNIFRENLRLSSVEMFGDHFFSVVVSTSAWYWARLRLQKILIFILWANNNMAVSDKARANASQSCR